VQSVANLNGMVFYMVEHCDVTVFVLERDIYACQAIVNYLSWDRRTHVIGRANALDEMISWLDTDDWRMIPDVIIVDTNLGPSETGLDRLIRSIRQWLPGPSVICLAHQPDPFLALAAARSGSCGYLVRTEVGVSLASAVCFTLHHPFVVTQGVMSTLVDQTRECPVTVDVLPARRKHPHLTQRLEQALSLCVIEGLPAEVAAEEMGVSTSTVRSYIKEVYRILEAEDDSPCLPTVSPAERAFMRYSALDEPINNQNYLPHVRRISTSVLWGGIHKGTGNYINSSGLNRSAITNQVGGTSGPITSPLVRTQAWFDHDTLTLIAQLLSGTVNGPLKD
jgi:DNA-binding NarL/FixJ family response regulator